MSTDTHTHEPGTQAPCGQQARAFQKVLPQLKTDETQLLVRYFSMHGPMFEKITDLGKINLNLHFNIDVMTASCFL